MNNQIIYVTDPLCLWCYGIATELETFLSRLPDNIDVKSVNGGLFIGNNAKEATADFRDYIKQASLNVTKLTSKSFDKPFWDVMEKQGFIYDTEPAARASVVVGMLKGESQKISYMKKLQEAVFVEGKDPTDPESLASVAVDTCGISKDSFLKLYSSHEAKNELQNEFAFVKKIGVQGFPAVILSLEGRLYQLCAGYSSSDELIKAFEWANMHHENKYAKTGASCDISGCE